MQRRPGAVDRAAGAGHTGESRSAWHRIYLGYAPGVGKTFEMLRDAREQQTRGTDVVVGWVQTYERAATVDALGELEIIAPRVLEVKGVAVDEMDVEAIVARRPQLVLVDELAHANVAGCRNSRRYQDVLELLAADIRVMSTLNIQQLADLQDTLRAVTGTTVSETVPAWVLDSADELAMVDATPETVRKRLRRGNVLPAQQVQQALGGYFRAETLMALRELTLQQVATHAQRKEAHGLHAEPISDETVLVCLPAARQAQAILISGVHLARRLHARLLVLHVTRHSNVVDIGVLQLARALGAEVHTQAAQDVVDALVRFASESGVTQLVLGEDAPRKWWQTSRRSTLSEILRRTRDMDVHIVRRRE
ncbi:MAG: sensor histidine kinase KdpD [Chloroflexi bacterium]|nr:sensor histidine kinase KdpD [Chloroflexota bacterium]